MICRLRSGHYLSAIITLLLHLLRLLAVLVGGHRQLALENLALRQQVAVYKRPLTRPRLRRTDRLSFAKTRPARKWLICPACLATLSARDHSPAPPASPPAPLSAAATASLPSRTSPCASSSPSTSERRPGQGSTRSIVYSGSGWPEPGPGGGRRWSSCRPTPSYDGSAAGFASTGPASRAAQPHGELLPKCEVLQCQLAVRANRGSQCPNEDPKPSDHGRSKSQFSPTNPRKSRPTTFSKHTRFALLAAEPPSRVSSMAARQAQGVQRRAALTTATEVHCYFEADGRSPNGTSFPGIRSFCQGSRYKSAQNQGL